MRCAAMRGALGLPAEKPAITGILPEPVSWSLGASTLILHARASGTAAPGTVVLTVEGPRLSAA